MVHVSTIIHLSDFRKEWQGEQETNMVTPAEFQSQLAQLTAQIAGRVLDGELYA